MTDQALTAEVPRTPLGDRIIFKFGRALNRMISWTMRPDRRAIYESKTAVYPALKILDDNYEVIR
jgi:hypothetical protein